MISYPNRMSNTQAQLIRAVRNTLCYLKDTGCKVIAMRELARYVDPQVKPEDPYAAIREKGESQGEVGR